jgi:enamine deaminase RidA (YjgF/YER057c/UK114 family)
MRFGFAALVVLVAPLALAQATRQPPPIKRTNPPTLARPAGYTQVVEVSGAVKTIYIAGQVSTDKDGNVVGANDMKAQAEQVFKNLEAALTAGGARFSDVVKMNMYATDLSQIQAIRDARAMYVGDATPASTLVQVVRLARPEFMLEIEAVAAVPERPRLVPATR